MTVDKNGFTKRIVASKSGLTDELFLIDSCSVIKEQISGTKPHDIYLKPHEGTVYSAPMKSHASLHAVTGVKKLFKRMEDPKLK